MKQVGKILQLFVSKAETSTRQAHEKLQLDQGGVQGDKFHNKKRDRSILLTSLASYEKAHAKGISMELGALGENLLIDYNPYHLPIGQQLQVGNDVVLEITQNCTVCNHLSSIDKALPKLLANDRGIFVKVIQGGEITKDDTIALL